MPNLVQTHSWDLTPTEAVALQKQMRDQVRLRPLKRRIHLIAGADISYNRFSEIVYAGIVVVRLPDLEIVSRVGVAGRVTFPYLPGLLSFRELPPLIEAWKRLDVKPHAVMLDGHGIAHPRRLGIASHFGLLLGLPTLGCAKTLLVGDYEVPGEAAGSTSPLIHKGEEVGAVLRTKDRVKPVFISPGHLMDIPGAVSLTLNCVKGFAQGKSRYRIPEPTRQAHLFVNELRRGAV